MTRPPQPNERGYSLVEVLLAAGLLAGVLVAICSLFIVGTQSVRSGRELTKATTIANSAIEQVLGWNFDKVYAMAGATSASSTQQWSTDLVNPSYTGTPSDVADLNAVADTWRERVEADLPEGVLTYRVDGVGALPTEGDDGHEAFIAAEFIRVTVTVEWTEARGRRRHVSFQELVL